MLARRAAAAAVQGRRRARAVTWSPLDLPGAFGIYECDDPLNTIDGSSRLQTWHDQSPYGNDLDTTSEAARPAYEGATAGAVFDGSTDFMTQLTPHAFGDQPTAASAVLIAQLLTTGATTVHARWMNASGTDRISIGASAAGVPRFLTSGTGGAASVGTTSVASAARMYWGRVTFGASQSCGVGTTAEDTDTITATYADLDGGRISLAGNSSGAGLVNIRVKALYLMRASIGSDDLALLLSRATTKGWI